jgi:hypothetical protein
LKGFDGDNMVGEKTLKIAFVLRLILGLWAIALGTNHWLAFLPEVSSSNPLFEQLIAAFRDSGVLIFAATSLVVAGLLLLANRLVVLALMVIAPINVVMCYWLIVLGDDLVPAIAVATTAALNALTLLYYRPYWNQFLEMNTQMVDEVRGEERTLMRLISGALYWFWGLWYLVSGSYYLYASPYYGDTTLAVQMIAMMVDTKLWILIKGTEFVGGIMLLTRRWAQLGLLLNIPISFVVVYWDIYLQGQFGWFGTTFGLTMLSINSFLIWRHRQYFQPVLAWRPLANRKLGSLSQQEQQP